ncbi:MAG: ribosomal protein S18-alanine N-acetyltransferase [Oscillospiraceae bacterium]|jgi:ribosomal-protein-alanine N-acetyltransferase|nr:ribosomal protein S18-alanine N-acetyltransferase [Oscillospiraceae bacterium]
MTRIIRAGDEAARRAPSIDHGRFLNPWSPAALAEETERTESRFAAAEEDGAFIGYAITRCYPERAELLCIAVDDTARGRGVGSMLLADAESYASEAGSGALALEVHERNPAAALYERRGYLAVGRRRGYYTHPEGDAILMEKELTRGGGA